MRLNRGTLAFLVVLIVVIVAAVFLTRQEDEPEVEPTEAAEVSGSVFEGITTDDITSFSLEDLETGALVALEKGDDDAWTISDISEELATDRAVDENLVIGRVGEIPALTYDDAFTIEDDLTPEDYGFGEMAVALSVTTDEDTQSVLVGNQNPSGNRYYVSLDDEVDELVTVPTTQLTSLLDLLTVPPYVPPPTPTPTLPPTLNPLSEVEQATATAQAMEEIEALMTQMAEVTPEATAEADAEDADVEAEAAENTEPEGTEADAEETEEPSEDMDAEGEETEEE